MKTTRSTGNLIEDQAAWKLTTAKLLADGPVQAQNLCKQILEQFSKTKSAQEAMQLFEKLNK